MKSIAEKLTDKAKNEKSLKKLIAKHEATVTRSFIDRHLYGDRYVFDGDGSVIDLVYLNLQLIAVWVGESIDTETRKVSHLCA